MNTVRSVNLFAGATVMLVCLVSAGAEVRWSHFVISEAPQYLKDFDAFSEADLEAARTEIAAIAVPRLLHCCFYGLYGNTDGSPREKTLALSILRQRGDYGDWFRDQFRLHAQPGVEYREMAGGVKRKFVNFPGINRADDYLACVRLFGLLEMVGTYESLVIALEYIEDDRYFTAPNGDVGTLPISELARNCVGRIVYQLGIEDMPPMGEGKVWQDWIAHNTMTLKTASERLRNQK